MNEVAAETRFRVISRRNNPSGLPDHATPATYAPHHPPPFGFFCTHSHHSGGGDLSREPMGRLDNNSRAEMECPVCHRRYLCEVHERQTLQQEIAVA
jgi:hypothetical protein